MKGRVTLCAGLVAACGVAAGALAGSAATPGVTETAILIGGTAPLSGEAAPAANVARGAEAYFKWVNARGGVNGRQITYKILDDAYDPARTVQGVRQLVQQDNVLAIFNTLGTNQNLAIRDFLNQAGVPQLFVGSGANIWGADAKRYPWTIGYVPTYSLEGEVYGQYVLRTKPRARVAVLYQDDPYGRDLLAGFRRGLGANRKQIAAVAKYDPNAADVQTQMAQLKAGKADVFMNFGFGRFALQAFIYADKLAWRPQIFVNAAASSANLMTSAATTAGRATTTGAISIVFFKDPNDPRWRNDAGIKLSRTILKAHNPSANPSDGYYVAGMASAFTLVDTLRKAGRNLTRDAVMRAARSLNEANNPFVLPGIAIRTSASDPFPIQQVGLQRWNGRNWVGFGGLVSG